MKKIKKISEYPFLIFFLFVIIAYVPVFLPFFHLKNDLITQNLPTRYFISESLYSGYFPWWNPYIHFGIPQYGDMNNGFWNPLLWFIAKTFGFNIWTITFEEMFYILIGGWGMYKVLKELNISNGIVILLGLSYMSCGYIVGHLQHFCWITGTAFFPFVCLYFLEINKNPILKNFICGALSVCLFVSSTHPGLIIGAGYFFVFSLFFIFIFRKTYCRDFYQPKFWLINLCFLLFSIIFSTVIIASDIDVLRHISRGSKVSLDQALLNPTSFQSYLSLLFPLTVNKSSFFATDISMRNMYTGLTIIIPFTFLLKYINKKIIAAILISLLFFVLLASGGIFKTIFYHALPLLGYVRLNGEFSYFTIVILILLTAFSIQAFITDKNFMKMLEVIIRRAKIFLVAILVISLLFILFRNSSIIHQKLFSGNLKITIKSVLDNLHFTDLLLINAFLQLLTLFFLGRKYSHQKAIYILACNLVITTWLLLPFTGLGMESKKDIDSKMTVLPHGLYAQELLPLNQTKFLDSSLKSELLLLGTYSKKIGYPTEEQYPIQLNTSKNFFEDTSLHRFINRRAFIFMSMDTTINSPTNFDSSLIKINEFGPGHLKVTLYNPDYKFLTFLQNNYPYWKVFVNNKEEPSFTIYKTFIGLQIAEGKQQIEFRFDPTPIKIALKINFAIIVIGIIILLIPQVRNKRVFN